MSENPRRGRQAINFTTNVPKILDLKSSSEQIFFRKLSLGAPDSRSSFFAPKPNGNACYAGYITTLKDHFSFGVSLHCCRPVKSYVNSRLGEEGECMLFKDTFITLKPFFIRDQAQKGTKVQHLSRLTT